MKILLVDDEREILPVLEKVIRGLGDDATVVSVAGVDELRAALKDEPHCELLLLDLPLGDPARFDLLAEVRQRHPALPVVVVSASRRASDVIRAIDLGAMGYVPKRAAGDLLFQALRLVIAGGIYVPPMALGAETEAPPPGGDTVPDVMRKEGAAAPPAPAPAAGLEALGLGPAETEVLMHLLQGRPNRLIAREMRLPVETVKAHVAEVLRRLGVSSRTQAVLAVSQLTQEQGQAIPAWRPSQR